MGADAMRAPVEVGAAVEVVTPEPGREMGGYASRAQPADGVLDDLCCRVVVLADGATTLALVVYDLLYVPARLAAAVTTLLSRALDTRPENVLVSATHTHCGPAIGGPQADPMLKELADAALRCASAAWEARVPARLVTTGFSVAGLVHHRRDPHEDVDETGSVLLALSSAPGHDAEVVAAIVTMACHPTILEGDTVAYSRDYPGVVCDTVESLCGGRAVFLQGFAGDVNPLFHDHSSADVRSFGRQVGSRAADAILAAQRESRDTWTINLSRGQEVPVALPATSRPVDAARLHGQLRRVPVESKPRAELAAIQAALADARRAVAEAGSPAQRHAAAALEAQWWIEELIHENPSYIGIDLPPDGTSTLPVQVLSLGPELRVVAVPGEPLQGVATKLRAALGDGLVLVGYAHAAASYLPCVEDFPHHGYEIGSTRYEPGTAERLVAAATAMAADPALGTTS